MSNQIICFYHSRDLDGWTSAAIVKRWDSGAKLVGWDYGDPEPGIYDVDHEYEMLNPTHPTITTPVDLRIPNKGVTVIIVDICFAIESMKKLASYEGIQVIWIDHHKSAIRDAADIDEVALMAGSRREDMAACELTWKFFFPLKVMPEAVRLLGRYDCFGHKGTDEERLVLLFQYAARAICDSPDKAEIFIDMDMDQVENVMNGGRWVYDYLCVEARGIFAKAFPVKFMEEHSGLMVNRERFNPVNFGIDYHKEGYEFFGCYWHDGVNWTFSLYNDNGKLDVSMVAKRFGGGGHQGAAGMVLSTEEFLTLLNEGGI